ncbi:MAG: FecR domain-containing protein [Candidatus Harrisonbacteria bacterium]|nr:FecR domain-containing protein [Candidatus Harrisonbacteria bacterium]
MKLSVVLALLGVAVLVGGGFLIVKQFPGFMAPEQEAVLEILRPWLEVVSPRVVELAPDQKTEIRELKTGDELLEGTVIKVQKGGLANIHFSDGSVARLDSDTRIILERGSYDAQKDSLVVRINLLWGRVWSKIITLATPESAWEVKTSTAVATVRGTAFGVEYIEEGKASFVGHENKVEVKMVDPDTKEVMQEVSMVVDAKKFLEVKKEAIQDMKTHLALGQIKSNASAVATEAGKALMEVKEVSEEVLKKDWVKRAIQEDDKLNQKIRELKERMKDEKEAMKEMRKELQEEFKDAIEDRRKEFQEKREQIKEAIKDEVKDQRENLELKTEEAKTRLESLKEEVQTVTRSVEVKDATEEILPAIKLAVQIIPKGLEVVAKNNLSQVFEGDDIFFQALLRMSDGSSRDVTDAVSWQVIGPIGRMAKPGMFSAGLSPEVSELGEAQGLVAVTWKNEKTGEAFLGKSPLFKVELKVDLNFDSTRG